MDPQEPSTDARPATAPSKWPISMPLYGVEIFAVANLAATFLVLHLHHLRVDWRSFAHTVKPLVVSLPRLFLYGLIVAVLCRLLQRRPVKELLRRLTSPAWWLDWLRMWGAILLTTYTYFWLKVNVPILNDRSWDQAFWDLDILLHFGISPSIFFTQLFNGNVLTGWMDLWYSVWKESVMLLSSGFLVLYQGRKRHRFTMATVLLWTFGAWGYVLLPAVGPIYVFMPHWIELLEQMPRATLAQSMLWKNYTTILSGLAGEQIHSFNPTQGVAAMPSLHVGAHAFLAFWAWRYLRPVFVVFLVATGLTFVGSVLTGWHYAVDGYAGILVAWLSFYLAERSRPRSESTPEGAETPQPDAPVTAQDA